MPAAPIPRSPRLPALLVLGGTLVVLLFGMLGLGWMAQRDRAAARTQLELIERALWLRGELHSLAAAESAWLIQGVADPLLRAQRDGGEIERSLRAVITLAAGDDNQQAHAKQLEDLVGDALKRIQGALADAGTNGPTVSSRSLAQGSIASQLDRVDSVTTAVHAGAQLKIQGHEDRAGSRLLWMALLGLLAAVCIGLMVLLLYFETRSRARAESEQGRLASLAEQAQKLAELRARDLQRLAELGDQLRPTKSIEELSEVLGAAMHNLFPQFDGALYLQAPSRNVIRRQVGWGKPNPPLEDLFTADDCWAIRRGVCYPTEAHAPPCKHLAPGTSPDRVLCVPLVAQGEVLGTLHLSGSVEPQVQERRLAQTIADQLALAVANLRLQENQRIQSVRDPLTSLFNRRYMEASLLRECLRARRAQQSLALLLVDLDNFKQFNERHGHEAGDAALAQVGALIAQSVRPEDIAGRYGGEKFMLLMPEADLALARDRAELVRRAIRATPIDLHGRRVEALTCSMGLAMYPLHGSEPALCLRAADKAVTAAKQAGRDRIEVGEAVTAVQPRPPSGASGGA